MLPLFCTNWNRISMSCVSCMFCGFGQRTKDWCEQIASHGILWLDRKTSRIIYIYWSDAFFQYYFVKCQWMGVIDCQFLIYEFNFMGNFSLEEIPSDGLENVYGQPQTIEQRNTMIGNSISVFAHCFCQTKITSIVRFLGRKENSIEKWFITRRGLWFSIPRWSFSQQKKNTEHDTGH